MIISLKRFHNAYAQRGCLKAAQQTDPGTSWLWSFANLVTFAEEEPNRGFILGREEGEGIQSAKRGRFSAAVQDAASLSLWWAELSLG